MLTYILLPIYLDAIGQPKHASSLYQPLLLPAIPLPANFLSFCLAIPEPVFVNVYEPQESLPLTFVAWRAGTTNRVVVPTRQAGNRFLGSLKGLQIRAQSYLLSTSWCWQTYKRRQKRHLSFSCISLLCNCICNYIAKKPTFRSINGLPSNRGQKG